MLPAARGRTNFGRITLFHCCSRDDELATTRLKNTERDTQFMNILVFIPSAVPRSNETTSLGKDPRRQDMNAVLTTSHYSTRSTNIAQQSFKCSQFYPGNIHA